MRRRLFAPLLALVVVATTLVLPGDTHAQRRQRRRRAPRAAVTLSGSQDARLNAIADAYLRDHFAFNPTDATAAGLHEYDATLESFDGEAVARRVRRLRSTLVELSRLREAALSPDAHYDFLVLQAHARGQLLELEDIRMWQRDPNVYNQLVAASIDNILKRNYASIEQRLSAVVARERQIARLLDEARANLQNPPRIYTETAIAQVRGSIDYFARVVPQMIERAGGGRLNAERRAEFNTTNQNVVAALRSYVEWLQGDLLPRSSGDFSIGAENFRRKLLYEEMVDTPAAHLLREGQKELRRTQEEMRALAEEIAPGRGVVAALRQLAREHPTADGLVGETRAELDRVRAFVRTQEILTPPARENLIVAETPEYARSNSFASMDAPGVFERMATEAYYYVTPPDLNWTPARRAEHLGFYNRYALPIISIHEVYPGHYYQLLAARNSPSRVRAALASSSFVEGWAHYCEQMMLDEGFGGNNPKLRLAQLGLALLRLCRYMVGLQMHTQGMTYEQGVEYFMREGYQERVNAEREARRGTSDPTSLVYTLGKMEILKLREDWRQRQGDAFRIGDFHDRLLNFGNPPVRIVRMALLGEDGNRDAPAAPDDAADDALSRVEFTVLATGTMSGYEGARSVELVTTEDEWRGVWRTIGGGRAAPEVNFNTRAVIVVYQGQQPTGGYGIAVSQIRRDGTVLAVKVNERRPASEDITTQVITSPFVAVSIPRPPVGAVVRFDDGQGSVEQNTAVRKRTVGSRTRRRVRRAGRRPF